MLAISSSLFAVARLVRPRLPLVVVVQPGGLGRDGADRRHRYVETRASASIVASHGGRTRFRVVASV